ncbi:MAG: dethiobiotin synthase [Nitrospirales bacterium]
MSVPTAPRSLFITATDTGVGKTVITGALLVAFQQQGEKVGVCKPIETGIHPQQEEQSDMARLRQVCSPAPTPASICLYRYEPPLSPLACSRRIGSPINLTSILHHCQDLARQHAITLIEGAGGLFTPLTPTQSILDLIKALQVPCLVVGRTDLGAINHALLTLRTLRQAGIPTHALVLNESSPADKSLTAISQRTSTVELIRELVSAPIFGPIGYENTIQSDWESGVRQLARHQEIQRLVKSLACKGP